MPRFALVAATLSLNVLALGWASPAFAKSEPTADDVSVRDPHSIVVDLKDGTSVDELAALDKELGLDLRFNSIEGEYDGIAISTDVEDVDGALEKLRGNALVESAEPLMEVKASFAPNDPQFGQQWNLQMIHMPKAWDTSHGKGVVVAVIDTGIAYEDHGDFKQVADLKGVKFVPGYNFVEDNNHPNDDHGHGTHVAGTIAQATDNGEGVAGIAFEATLMPIKVLNHFGSGNTADISDAIRWAADHGANVINMSLGGGGRSSVMEAACAYAKKKGVTVIAAAGNTGFGRVEYPAAYPDVIAVGAVGPSGDRAPYSSYGEQLDLVAPGGDKRQGAEGGILQNTIDARDVSKSVYESYQGTSMAAPHVAGVAALLISAGAKTPDDVAAALFAGAHAHGEAWNAEYGHGLLDAEASLASLKRTTSAPVEPVVVESAAPAALGLGEDAPNAPAEGYGPLLAGLALMVLALVTISPRLRPGYLNVLFRPGFLIAFLLSTVGAFFLRKWAFAHGSTAVEMLAIPIPDWQRIIWGRGKLANPLVYSALIPALTSALGIPFKVLRPVFSGLAMGFGGFLAYAAWSGAPALAYLPFSFLARPWLIVNALICAILARALLRKEA